MFSLTGTQFNAQMRESRKMSSGNKDRIVKIVVEAKAGQRKRRASELFVDGRFKPRVVNSGKAYSRKNTKINFD